MACKVVSSRRATEGHPAHGDGLRGDQMTVNLSGRYGVTITCENGPKGFVALGEIFDRRTMEDIGIQVRGEGRTVASAGDRAIDDARAKCPRA